MKNENVTIEDVKAACKFSWLVEIKDNRIKPKWDPEVYTAERIDKSRMWVKNLPMENGVVTADSLKDYFKRFNFRVEAVSLASSSDGTFNGHAACIAETVDHAIEIEQYFEKNKPTWNGYEMEILRRSTYDARKKQASPPGQITIPSIPKSKSPSETLSMEQHRFLEDFKRSTHYFEKFVESACYCVTPQGPFVFHLELIAGAIDGQTEPIFIKGSVLPVKKAALRSAEFKLAKKISSILKPEEYTYIEDESELDDQKIIWNMSRLAEAKRLQAIYRELSASSSRMLAMRSGNLVAIVGQERSHTKEQVKDFNFILKLYPSLNTAVAEMEKKRRKVMEEKGVMAFSDITVSIASNANNNNNLTISSINQSVIENVVFPKKTKKPKNDDDDGDQDDDDESLESEDVTSPALNDNNHDLIESTIEEVLEEFAISVPASMVQVGFMEDKSSIRVLWQTACKVSIMFEELTPRLNILWRRHNSDYQLINILKNVEPLMWIETDLGYEFPQFSFDRRTQSTDVLSGSSASISSLHSSISEASAGLAIGSSTDSLTSSAPSSPLIGRPFAEEKSPSYLDFYIPIDASPKMTRQEHFQKRKTGSLDFTPNAVFSQATIIRVQFDLKNMEKEKLVKLLTIVKALVRIGLLKCKCRLPQNDINTSQNEPLSPHIAKENTEMAISKVTKDESRSFERTNILVGTEPDFEPPNRLFETDFWVRWKLVCLISQRLIRINQVTQSIVDLMLQYRRIEVFRVLEKLESRRTRIFDFEDHLRSELKNYNKNDHQSGSYFSLKDSFTLVAHCAISPLEIRCEGPLVEVSNRLIRAYSPYKNHFFRVAFKGALQGSSTGGSIRNVGRLAVRQRVGGILTNGFLLPSMKHLLGFQNPLQFLVSSSSQLRTHKAWFFSPPNQRAKDDSSSLPLTIEGIRAWLGDFSHIFNVAMYSARLGQGLSSTYYCFEVKPEWIREVPDVKRNGYNFSDGCSAISLSIAKRAADALGRNFVPSVFQIRLGGIKGVVSIDTRLEGDVICVRPSMNKFKSLHHNAFEVVCYSRPLPAHLNKQIIQILSALGVPDQNFLDIQQAAFRRISAATFPSKFASERSRQERINQLEKSWNIKMKKDSLGSRIVQMLRAGFSPHSDPYLSSIMTAVALRSLQDIHTMARIPIEKGQYAIGIMDETGLLQPGQVFFRRSLDHERKESIIQKGTLCISRSPALHPGDVRFVEAVDVPELRHLFDTIVFPQTGERPIPDECSGGDLDGDQYLLIWGEELFPPNTTTPAWQHQTSEQGSIEAKDDNEVYPSESVEFFVNYIFDDKLSAIADAHTYWADQCEAGVFDEKCIRLAEAHNIAVDAPKTGKVVPQMEELSVPRWPDFMNLSKANCYISKKILGKLYRSSAEEFVAANTEIHVEAALDSDLIVDGYQQYVPEALELRDEYSKRLQNIMDLYKLGDEASAMTGEVLYQYRSERKEWENQKEGFDAVSGELKAYFRQQFLSVTSIDEQKKKASAWYFVTYALEYRVENPHWSFAWIADDILCQIKHEKKCPAETTEEVVDQKMNEDQSACTASDQIIKLHDEI